MYARSIIVCFFLLSLGGCGNSISDPTPPPRGIILISLDTLRADHLGAYGSVRDTSPFFDQLSRRGILFEHSYVQYPSTLTSHMSMFTGLHPSEHSVLPPNSVLSESIDMLAEVLQREGIRTCGVTEGGFVSATYGFSRGFDSWADPQYHGDQHVEETFERGLEFLRTISADDRFFLFLHTYAIHDPYLPPAGYSGLYHQGPSPEDNDSNGKRLRSINLGEDEITPETVAYFEAEYDATIRYVDDVIKSFVNELKQLGLDEQAILVITSDHGEEFKEHGKLAHTQIYPECIHVPLLIVDPQRPNGQRVPEIVESVDLAPTLIELLGLPPWQQPSGESLVPLIKGETRNRSMATAECSEFVSVRTLLTVDDGDIFQLIVTEHQHEKMGTWISDSVVFDKDPPLEEIEMRAFDIPRLVEIIIDDHEAIVLEVGTRWQRHRVAASSSDGAHRITVKVDGCASPQSLGRSKDRRCLGLFITGEPLQRRELFNLTTDPAAQVDISKQRTDLLRSMMRELVAIKRPSRAEASKVELSEAEHAKLEALGYLH